MRKLALLIAAPLLLALVACSGSAATSAPGRGAPGGAGDTFTNIGAPLAVPAPEAQKAGGVAVGQPAAGLPNPVVFNADRNLVRTANIAMRSKDPWATSERAAAIAVGFGGDVLGLAQAGNGEDRRANLTIRVPASRFDDALNQIKQLEGEVATANVDTKDVTDQFVDLQARLAAKQSEEQRYLALLNRANTIDEILKVDAAITNVRTQVEQLTSTIVLSVTPLTVLPGVDNTAKGWDPAKTLARALAAVSALFQVIADLAIWALVFGFVPLIGLAVVAVATRGRHASAPTAPTV
ncbi:MAG: DUF4349 domain-containing protein [Actinobacteria bacterium]|nr:MAG: DUF4349 domain-containing protein [Actinomycetota bacterium]